jgi:hypothetical protein
MNSLPKKHCEQDQETVKRPYATPKVQVYGDLRQLTNGTAGNKSVNPDGSSDGPNAKHTH